MVAEVYRVVMGEVSLVLFTFELCVVLDEVLSHCCVRRNRLGSRYLDCSNNTSTSPQSFNCLLTRCIPVFALLPV